MARTKIALNGAVCRIARTLKMRRMQIAFINIAMAFYASLITRVQTSTRISIFLIKQIAALRKNQDEGQQKYT